MAIPSVLPKGYHWVICESPSFAAPTAPLRVLAPMRRARNRSVEYGMNRAGAGKWSLWLKDPVAELMFANTSVPKLSIGTVKRSLMVVRDGAPLCQGWRSTLVRASLKA